MEAKSTETSNVIRFPGPRSRPFSRRDQRSLMDAVYTAGSLPIAAETTTALVPLGEHALRGIAAPRTVFTLPGV